jgi:multidrug efflux pump subunit AcrA (membrane-fusion protein)
MIFRFKALAKMREPDELDAPTILAAPRGWVTVFVLLIVTIAAVAWMVIGRLPQTVSANGLITQPAGAAQVQSLYAGLIGSVQVRVGTYVSPGQDLVTVLGQGGVTREVTSSFAGQVVSIAVSTGQIVGVGSQVITMERTEGGSDRLVAMLFVSSRDVAGIIPGQSVTLAVSSAPAAAFGLLRGRVSSISQYPLTSLEISALVGGDLPIGPLEVGGAPYLVTVSLLTDNATVTGYSWTTAGGPPTALALQVPAAGTVTLGTFAPITLLFNS